MCLKCSEHNGKKYGHNLRSGDKRVVHCFIAVGWYKIQLDFENSLNLDKRGVCQGVGVNNLLNLRVK